MAAVSSASFGTHRQGTLISLSRCTFGKAGVLGGQRSGRHTGSGWASDGEKRAHQGLFWV